MSDERETTPELSFHALRQQLYDELHSRPSPLVKGAAYISHFAQLLDPSERQAERQHLEAFCQRYHQTPPDQAICQTLLSDDLEFRWERHQEFSTYTFIRPCETALGFKHTALELLPPEWLGAMPGQTLVALHLTLQCDADAVNNDELLVEAFEGYRAVASVTRGKARIYSAFRIHSDGFARILLRNDTMSPYQLGYAVKRALEVETYRNLTLLALPLAKGLAEPLRDMETTLMEITQGIAREEDLSHDEQLLQQLSGMAVRLEKLRAECSYRFSASQAYYELMSDRLREMYEERIPSFQTWQVFIDQRLAPAVRTIVNFQERLEGISDRIARASELLRARVELHIEQQNREVHEAMNRRSAAQYRLQETVERLSIVAIAYYGVGLLGYLLAALSSTGMAIDIDLLLGFSVPLVLVLIVVISKGIRRKLRKRLE